MSNRPLGCLFEVVETLVLTVIIFLVIQTFIAQPYRVEQQSMERTLEPDQYVLVDKLTPRFSAYKHGDIIVFDPPEEWSGGVSRSPFIKRVIGVPGDVVEIDAGDVLVNGERILESYVFDCQPTTATGDQNRWVVGEGELFVMGDHRSNSADSRVFGSIRQDRVIGRAWLRYWPLSDIGILPSGTFTAPCIPPA